MYFIYVLTGVTSRVWQALQKTFWLESNCYWGQRREFAAVGCDGGDGDSIVDSFLVIEVDGANACHYKVHPKEFNNS